MAMPMLGNMVIDPDEYFSTDVGIPFHLLRRQKATQPHNQGTGSSNQLTVHGLDNMFNKFSDRNIKDGLSNFLPHLPGYVDAPCTADDSLQCLIDKPPVGGRELAPLTDTALQGFRLMPGSVPDQYKFMNKPPEKRKKKKHKHHDDSAQDIVQPTDPSQERKHKKRKKEEGDKRKKEKKKKKKKDKKGDHEETTAS